MNSLDLATISHHSFTQQKIYFSSRHTNWLWWSGLTRHFCSCWSLFFFSSKARLSNNWRVSLNNNLLFYLIHSDLYWIRASVKYSKHNQTHQCMSTEHLAGIWHYFWNSSVNITLSWGFFPCSCIKTYSAYMRKLTLRII